MPALKNYRYLDNKLSIDGLFLIYPNPSTGRFPMEYILFEPGTIVIQDVLGRVVWKKELARTLQGSDIVDIDIPGIYMIFIKRDSIVSNVCKHLVNN